MTRILTRLLPVLLSFGVLLGAGSCVSCPLALLEGVLAAGPGEQFVARHSSGDSGPIRWPDGYAVRRGSGGLLLTNRFGDVVAHEGDSVRLGGGQTGDGDGFAVCGEMTIIPASS